MLMTATAGVTTAAVKKVIMELTDNHELSFSIAFATHAVWTKWKRVNLPAHYTGRLPRFTSKTARPYF
jgi:hypothetical protein